MPVILFKRQTIETYAPTHAKRGNVPKKMGEHATEIVYNFEKKKKEEKKVYKINEKRKKEKKRREQRKKKRETKGAIVRRTRLARIFSP